MKFIYTPVKGMADPLTKYNIKFIGGKEVEVIDLKSASKLQTCPYMSVCVEKVDEEKPKRTRRTPAQMEEARRLEATDNGED